MTPGPLSRHDGHPRPRPSQSSNAELEIRELHHGTGRSVPALLDRGLLGRAPQFTSEVLLERLPAPLGTTLKRRLECVPFRRCYRNTWNVTLELRAPAVPTS